MGAAMPDTDNQDLEFLSTKAVMKKLEVSRTKLYEIRMSEPDFPQPVRFGKGTGRQVQLRWVRHEVDAWLLDKMNSR